MQPTFAQHKQAHFKNLKYWDHQKKFEKEIIVFFFLKPNMPFWGDVEILLLTLEEI